MELVVVGLVVSVVCIVVQDVTSIQRGQGGAGLSAAARAQVSTSGRRPDGGYFLHRRHRQPAAVLRV